MAAQMVMLVAVAALLAYSAAGARSLHQTVDATVINNVLAAYQRDPQGTVNTIASRTCPACSVYAGCQPSDMNGARAYCAWTTTCMSKQL